MNYRHAFHAGNFGDVMKHVFATRILVHLKKKSAPFFVLDTHAGCGLYDLASPEATRTGESQGGIALVDAGPLEAPAESLLAPYRHAVAAARQRYGKRAYPGSPLLVREFLRPGDRALAVELHPQDFAALAANLARAGRIKALHLDGWMALSANIPPKERRGLVLVDPPYEQEGEMRRAVAELAKAWAKWPTGIYVLWYPIKDKAATERLGRDFKATALRKVLRLELMVDGGNADALVGSGLIVINPPFDLMDEAAMLLPALARRLSRQGSCRAEWLAGEV